MRVLVAGDRGYIGAVLVPFLQGPGTRSTGSTSACMRDVTSAPGQRASARGQHATSGTPRRASWLATTR